MKTAKPRFDGYPGNDWLAGIFGKLGVEISVPFAHGVLRGTLINPAKADPSKAFFQILRTKTPLHKRQAETDMAIEGLMCLGDDIIECYLFDEDLPPAMPVDGPSCPDFRTLAGRIIDLTDGFYIGLSSAPIPRECRIKSCDAWVEGIVKEAKGCVQWFENPGAFDSRYTDPEQRRSLFNESLKRIETNMVLLGRHVADTVKMPDAPFTVTISKVEDDCPICAAAKGHGLHGHKRARGNIVRH